MKLSSSAITQFRRTILDNYKEHGRRLPWRETNDPYKIVISEVMLQQTQVLRVIPKYESFIKRFPDFKSLAHASNADVLSLWSGLGYNRRALLLKRCAEVVVLQYNGKLPDNPELLVELPCIGKATAASICAFAFNKPTVFIETNVRSVFIHFFFKNKKEVHDKDIVPLVEQTVDRNNAKIWYNALMDYGVKLKTELGNPSRKSRHHIKQSKFEGSGRQVRGIIMKLLLSKEQPLTAIIRSVRKETEKSKDNIVAILTQLQKEGFLEINGKNIRIKK